ncbi:putative MIF4G-like, type 3, MIF4G-like domain superfamily protein [Helianthus annuus]|nr:putative MIF4G-like, type 3, MIF4G-like domain superfamily protein [Helianthus annuus]
MQADQTVLSLRPGGGNRGRTSGPRFDSLAFGSSDLRPNSGSGGGSSLAAFKSNDSREFGERIHYTRDQLLQLRELKLNFSGSPKAGPNLKETCQISLKYATLSLIIETGGEELRRRVMSGLGILVEKNRDFGRFDNQPNSQFGRTQASPNQGIGGPTPALVKAEVPWSCSKRHSFRQRSCLEDSKRLTPEKFDLLKGQLIDSGITTADILKGVISLIFDKAVLEPTFCPMYAQLCSDLNTKLPPFPSDEPDGKDITFKRVLLNNCQEAFEGADNLRG